MGIDESHEKIRAQEILGSPSGANLFLSPGILQLGGEGKLPFSCFVWYMA